MADSKAFEPLLATPEPAELGPGPRAGVHSEEQLARELKAAFRETGISGQQQELIRALVLLWHDHLDAAHAIAQAIENASGAFVHGIMHRREPDYSNATYWFHRVGQHPAFPEIARRVSRLLEEADELGLRAELVPGGRWDALAFIRACEQAAGHPKATGQGRVLRHIQRAETEALLSWFCGAG